MKAAIKKDWLKRAKEHAKMDRFIKGTWLNGQVGEFKSGCFFGCMTQCEENTIQIAAKQMQSPLWIVHLAEQIFEGLPEKESASFPVDYLNAIPKNLSDEDYELIRHGLAAKRMQRMYDLVEKIETKEAYKKECLDAISLVLEYHQKPTESAAKSAEESAWSASKSAEESAWSAAKSAEESAWSASKSAAWSAKSAAESTTWSAESAAWSAKSASKSAAWSAESSAAESPTWSEKSAAWSAKSAAYLQERDDLFNLFNELR